MKSNADRRQSTSLSCVLQSTPKLEEHIWAARKRNLEAVCKGGHDEHRSCNLNPASQQPMGAAVAPTPCAWRISICAEPIQASAEEYALAKLRPRGDTLCEVRRRVAPLAQNEYDTDRRWVSRRHVLALKPS